MFLFLLPLAFGFACNLANAFTTAFCHRYGEKQGRLMTAAGGVVILAALSTIRVRSIAPSARDTLVQNGLYDRVRHPIHSGVMLEFAGLALIVPTLTTAAACFLGLVWVQLQTRFEEYDLLRRLPGYRDYMDRVLRFFPRLRY